METPVDSFLHADSLVGSSLKEGLARFFGFNQFKGEQEEIMTSLMEGRNAFVIMPTGGGKSMCYQLPALLCEGTALVVSPLIALMKNQVDQMNALGINAQFLNSTLSKAELNKVRAETLSGEIRLLYVAPESLTKPLNIERCNLLINSQSVLCLVIVCS